MPSLLLPSCYTQQPQHAVQIDWSNPITRGLAFAFIHGVIAFGFCTSGQNAIPYVGAVATPTPIGLGAKSTSTSNRAYSLGNHGIAGTNYSLFAVGTATSNAVTQSAIDSDNGTTQRYVQFRLNNGKVDLIPFNTSAAVTGQPVFANALTSAEMARGFTMGAAVSATRAAAFQNAQVATATPSGLASIPAGSNLSIGARITGVTGWATGGLSCAYGWNATKADADMLSLAENPWQIWKFPARRLWYSTTSASDATGSLAATLDGVSFSMSGEVVNVGAFASTLGGAFFVVSGTVGNAPSGAIASTLAGASIAAAGNITTTGSLASTLEGASMSASGITTSRGALASALDGANLAASGAVTSNATGALASTLDDTELAAGGYVGTPPAAPDFFIRLPKNPRHVIHH
jgi:hypothetical protein